MDKLKKILLLCDGFYLLSGGLLGPIYALFVEKIGGDLLDASTTFSLFMLSAAVVSFLLALIEDRSKHPRKFVIAGYGLGMVGSFGYLFVDSATSLFIIQGILGFAVALKDPAYDALFSKASQKHLALAWGEWEAVDYLVLGLGALLGGFIANQYGFTTLLWCMAVLSVVSFVLSLMLLKLKNL